MNHQINEELLTELIQEQENFLSNLESIAVQCLLTGNFNLLRDYIDQKEEEMNSDGNRSHQANDH